METLPNISNTCLHPCRLLLPFPLPFSHPEFPHPSSPPCNPPTPTPMSPQPLWCAGATDRGGKRWGCCPQPCHFHVVQLPQCSPKRVTQSDEHHLHPHPDSTVLKPWGCAAALPPFPVPLSPSPSLRRRQPVPGSTHTCFFFFGRGGCLPVPLRWEMLPFPSAPRQPSRCAQGRN